MAHMESNTKQSMELIMEIHMEEWLITMFNFRPVMGVSMEDIMVGNMEVIMEI